MADKIPALSSRSIKSSRPPGRVSGGASATARRPCLDQLRQRVETRERGLLEKNTGGPELGPHALDEEIEDAPEVSREVITLDALAEVAVERERVQVIL